MVPRASESLSFLMGAQSISDEELTRLGVEIVQRVGSGIRGLLVPDRSLQAYRELIRLKLTAGFWNETVGRSEIFFQFKLDDGTLKEFAYLAANREEIARLCSKLNGDPLEKTSDIPHYLAENPFYRELMLTHHGVSVHKTEKLGARDFESAAALLAEAFFSNPAHVYFFPHEKQRHRALPWLLQRSLAAQAPGIHSFCVAQESGNPPRRTIVAMGFWHPPGSSSVSVRGLLRPAFLAVPIRCGFGAARRLLEVTRYLEEERRAALGSAPAWYLNNMAVAAHLRGSGLGTELLACELRSRIDPTGHVAALATQRPENVRFYRRLGFEVVSDRTLGSSRRGFRNWIMVREPKS